MAIDVAELGKVSLTMLKWGQDLLEDAVVHLADSLPDPRTLDSETVEHYVTEFDSSDATVDVANWLPAHVICVRLLRTHDLLVTLANETQRIGILRRSKPVCTPYESESFLKLARYYEREFERAVAADASGGKPWEQYWTGAFLYGMATANLRLCVDLSYILLATGVPQAIVKPVLQPKIELLNKLGLTTNVELTPSGFSVRST